jgi:hypothetical protein
MREWQIQALPENMHSMLHYVLDNIQIALGNKKEKNWRLS